LPPGWRTFDCVRQTTPDSAHAKRALWFRKLFLDGLNAFSVRFSSSEPSAPLLSDLRRDFAAGFAALVDGFGRDDELGLGLGLATGFAALADGLGRDAVLGFGFGFDAGLGLAAGRGLGFGFWAGFAPGSPSSAASDGSSFCKTRIASLRSSPVLFARFCGSPLALSADSSTA